MSEGSIVAIDDMKVNRAFLASILERAGYRVRTAASGREGLELIGQELPELVLLDIQMPDMDGYEVCRQIKSRPELSAIPVVFISTMDDVSDKVKSFEAGGSDYVTRPFQPMEVLARVSNQIKLFRLQNEMKVRNAELQRRNEELVRSQERTKRVFIAFSDSMNGSVLDDTYRLDEKIGKGGYGVVFRGVHLSLQRPVAIKILRPTSASDPQEDLARFRTEGIAACRISHRNAVEVLDFRVSSNGFAYLVMELLSGRTIDALMREHLFFEPRRCIEIVAPVCDALAAAHAAGIVHRDIKPDNVFLHRVDGEEVVKVVDFGIAKLLDESESNPARVTRHGVIAGTPEYIAPERLLGEPYDTRSDVYGVGVLLYVMLSGQLPFVENARPTMYEMMGLQLTSAPRPLREAKPDVPMWLDELVMKTLARDPARRPDIAEVGLRLRTSDAQ